MSTTTRRVQALHARTGRPFIKSKCPKVMTNGVTLRLPEVLIGQQLTGLISKFLRDTSLGEAAYVSNALKAEAR